MKEPQNDELWKDWPAAPEPEPQYVIAKSDVIENVYWRAQPLMGLPEWGTLANATRWTHADIDKNREPEDGFWMTLERAQELEP